jgi:UDP-N-acetylmuramyl pentapeptide phosphotransferase/UDP-N-acetylglucosamine-1-phosphate transferase
MRAMLFLPALTAFLASLACLGILLSPIGRHWMLDRPNERSLHSGPVPRSGGISIAAGVAAYVVASDAVSLQGVVPILGIAGALAVVSLVDDILTLPALVRLAAHFAAAVAVLSMIPGDVNPVHFALLLLAIAWFANLYNFMDGSDGLAGGMTVFGFGSYAWAAYQAGHVALTTASGGIAISTIAFLLANFHPARLFMGDVGSVPLGFLAGALGVLGWRDGVWPLWFPVLVFAPFVCDATLTLVKRLLRRERVWEAHKEHYYQRLVRMGFGHRATALIEYGAMAGCAATAMLFRSAEPASQAGALGAAAVTLVAIAVWIDTRWARWSRTHGDSGGATA